MKKLLVDLGRHQSWADAELWGALEKCGPAKDDSTIHNRLHHLHFVQRAFCWLLQGKEVSAFPMTTPQDYSSFGALRSYARESSVAMADFIDTVADARLNERVQMPWFQREPPFSIAVGEAYLQAVMHSQWHRGQNATRLRELGGEPPTLDLIVWYLNDRPAATWDNRR
jgi:uncharacterized damage-inducible protein DinB